MISLKKIESTQDHVWRRIYRMNVSCVVDAIQNYYRQMSRTNPRYKRIYLNRANRIQYDYQMCMHILQINSPTLIPNDMDEMNLKQFVVASYAVMFDMTLQYDCSDVNATNLSILTKFLYDDILGFEYQKPVSCSILNSIKEYEKRAIEQ